MTATLQALIEKASTPMPFTRHDGRVFHHFVPSYGVVNGKDVGVFPIEQCRRNTAKNKNRVYMMFKVDGKRVKSSEINKALAA